MRVACLAWGSLIWDPRTLPHESPFRDDGLWLPIEFSRVTLDGRVTLVIDPEAEPLQTYWVPLRVDSLDEAVDALGRRERIKPERWDDWVGRAERGGDAAPATLSAEDLDAWLAAHDLDAVVWTALPARFPDGRLGRVPIEALCAHLESLEGEALARAEEYIRRAPPRVRTRNRAEFERRLGWTEQRS